MGNATRWINNPQVGTGLLLAAILIFTVYDSPLPSSVQNVLYGISIVFALVVSFWDMLVPPRRYLQFLNFFKAQDDTKAMALSSWAISIIERLDMGYSIHSDLIWLEQYLSKHLTSTMSRGTLTGVERLCKRALELKREDPGICLSIYQLVLSKTNRSSEIEAMWKRYASVPGVSSSIDTLNLHRSDSAEQ